MRATRFTAMRFSLAACGVMAAVLWASAGCQRDNSGTYPVSGTVTYDGKPVPTGFIRFMPDTSQGNSGPGGGAPIRDGKFRTAKGKGVVGGPYEVYIVGYTGQRATMQGEELEDGPPLFQPYTMAVEFPEGESKHEFAVPKE